MKLKSAIAAAILSLLLACGANSVQGAESQGTLPEFAVRIWSKADGLPNAPITAIVQARDGYLWIGTGGGLIRFDGMKFTGVALTSKGTNESVSITALCEDTSNRLWIGSQQQGLFCLKEGTANHFGTEDGLLDAEVTSLTTDNKGQLWIGTKRGANRLDEAGFTAFTKRDGLLDDLVTSVHAARAGAVWITTRGGICKFMKDRLAPFEFQTASQGRNPEFLGAYEDPQSNLWAFGASYLINLTEGKRFNYFHVDEPSAVRIWSLCAGKDGRLWIGTSGHGLFCFDGSKFLPVPPILGSMVNDIRAICEDSEGNLWLGISEGGLARLRPEKIILVGANQGLPAGSATCLALDSFQRLVVGMERGGLFMNLGARFEGLSERTGLIGQDSVSSIAADKDGGLWVGTGGSGLLRTRGGRVAQLTTENGLSDNCVVSVCTDTEGAVSIGTRSGGLHRMLGARVKTFSESDGSPESPITTLLPARGGGVWVGTESGALLHGNQSSLQAIRVAPRLVGRPIVGAYEDLAGRLWLASAGGGLGCLEARRCRAWGLDGSGLDDLVFGVVDDVDGNLWLLTNKGVCRVGSAALALALTTETRLKTRLISELPAGSGRALLSGGQRLMRSPDGRLWFACGEGLLVTNPRDWLAEPPPPPVRIESILVNNKPLKVNAWNGQSPNKSGTSVRLPGKLRAMEIQFTALNFAAPEKLRFRHRLGAFDSDWVETDMERRVRYGGLPPGSYEFQVTARNGDGPWNEPGASFAFVVPTTPWRSAWALGLYGLAIIGLVVRVVRVVSHRRLRRKLERLEQQQAMERERVRIAQDMHDEIGSKLTKISYLSERAKVELEETGPAAGKIDAIAHTSRELLQALDEIVWAVNPRNDTLEHLAAYLAQYAAEYFQDTKVECELRLQRELPQLAMSAETRHNLFLAFEEALNNVLKHSGATRVRVEIKTDEDRFRITIEDNGCGFAPGSQTASPQAEHAGSGGNGLVNMRERLVDIHGECELRSCQGTGTTVNLSIPLRAPKIPRT